MDQKDHDLLIKLDSKLTALCSSLNKFSEENEKQHEDIRNILNEERKETDKKIGKKTDVWIFRTAIGIMVAVMMGMSYSVVDNNKNISKMLIEFEDHSAFAAIAWEKFTGQPWGAASRMELNEAKQKYQLERKLAREREIILKSNKNIGP